MLVYRSGRNTRCSGESRIYANDLRSVDGRARFASVNSFLNGMTKGSPSTRHAVALLADDARGRFFDDVRAALVPYMDSGLLAYPMRTHILVAHTAPN